MGVKLDKTAPATTPETLFTATSDSTLRSDEIALIRLTLGSEFVVILTIIKSFTFKLPKVFPAHCKLDTPADAVLILTSSPSPRFGINFGCNTKSPLKSTPDINVSS